MLSHSTLLQGRRNRQNLASNYELIKTATNKVDLRRQDTLRKKSINHILFLSQN